MLRIAALLASLLSLTSVAFADKITLKDGGKIEGRVIAETETSLTVEVQIGNKPVKVTVLRERIETHEKSMTQAEEYAALVKKTGTKDADSLTGLAQWCLDRKMKTEAVEHLKQALLANPEHAGAEAKLKSLGYVKVGEMWTSETPTSKQPTKPVGETRDTSTTATPPSSTSPVTGKEALPAKPVPQGRTVQLIVNATCAGAPAPANFAGVRNMAVAVLEGAGFKVVDSAAERADREFTIAVRGTPIDVLVSKQAGGPPKTRREPGEKPNYLGAIVEGEVAGEKYRGTHNFAKMIDGRYTNPFGLELTDPMDAPYEATLWGSVVRETDYLWVLTHQAAKMSGMGRAWILVSVMSKHPELLPKETVRSMIIVAGKDPKTANDTVAALADALSSESAVIRAFAAGALQYCPEAGKASAALARALQDKDEKVRHEAAMALRSLSHSSGAAAPSSIPALTEALASGYPDARREAALALGSMGMQAKEAIPALAKAMDDEFFSVQMEAIRALGAMAREDASARTALSDALRSKKADVRRLAGDELSKLGGTGKSSGDKGSDRAGAEILAALTTALADANPATRKSAAESLERMGEKAKDAVPALTKALQDDDWDVRQKAVKALERVGPLAKSAVPALCALLSESANAGQKGIIGIYIVNAVTRIAPDDSAVHDALIKALANHQTEATREYAAGALGDIRAPISVSVPALVTALNDPKLNVTLRAARSLGKLGPAAKDAIPALTQALNHHFYETCGCAAMALGNIGPAAKSAIPALRALAEKYKGKNVGEAAEKAIREIEK